MVFCQSCAQINRIAAQINRLFAQIFDVSNRMGGRPPPCPPASYGYEETLLVILLIHGRNPSILARVTNYMSPNPLWTLSNLPNHLPYLTAVALAHPTLNTPRIDYSPSFKRVCVGQWICPFPCWTGDAGVYAI